MHRKLCTELNEVKGWSTNYNDQIKSYLYNHRSALPSHELGVSTYGTCQAMVDLYDIDAQLAQPSADIYTCGVIGHYFDPSEKRTLVLFSSPRLAMFALEEMHDGFGEGKLQVDHTFKICKEKTPVIVCCCPLNLALFPSLTSPLVFTAFLCG